MTVKEFIQYILNNVNDLNGRDVAIRNYNWLKNGLSSHIKLTEENLEVAGDFLIIHLPEGTELQRRGEDK
jgi:uncharacterized phage infection (PIP) family protein YhgE